MLQIFGQQNVRTALDGGGKDDRIIDLQPMVRRKLKRMLENGLVGRHNHTCSPPGSNSCSRGRQRGFAPDDKNPVEFGKALKCHNRR